MIYTSFTYLTRMFLHKKVHLRTVSGIHVITGSKVSEASFIVSCVRRSAHEFARSIVDKVVALVRVDLCAYLLAMSCIFCNFCCKLIVT